MYHIITWDLRQNVIQMYMYIFVPVKMKIIYWSCPCVGLVRWLVGSLQIFLEVLFWMLSDVPHHYLRFETECHTDRFTCTYFFCGFEMSGKGLGWYVNNLWKVWTGFSVNNHKINFVRRCEGFNVLRKFRDKPVPWNFEPTLREKKFGKDSP